MPKPLRDTSRGATPGPTLGSAYGAGTGADLRAQCL
jgi:hypothetical protein